MKFREQIAAALAGAGIVTSFDDATQELTNRDDNIAVEVSEEGWAQVRVWDKGAEEWRDVHGHIADFQIIIECVMREQRRLDEEGADQ